MSSQPLSLARTVIHTLAAGPRRRAPHCIVRDFALAMRVAELGGRVAH